MLAAPLSRGLTIDLSRLSNVRRLQEVRKGFTWGTVTIAPLAEEEEEDGGASGGPSVAIPVKADDRLVIPFQNENLYAYVLSADGQKKVRLSLPSPARAATAPPLTPART